MRRCSHWLTEASSSRCSDAATVQMYAPDGGRIPGGWYCRPCAETIVQEYEDKLDEIWTCRDLVTP